ncbi:MAG: DUF4313 domain-containing protein [Clostridiales bacterium]|nr:DUF4313 domain-containing protein [Clostridiales bacterium]
MYDLKICNKKYEVEAFKTSYQKGEGLAVVLENEGEEFAVITTNLPGNKTAKDCAFIDNNNCKWAEDFLVKHNIAHPTNRCVLSGFWIYPEYRFDLTKLKDYETQETSKKKNDIEM